MKNARRNIALAAVAAATLALAPSAPADVRIRLDLPLPPPPREVLRHLPSPPPLPVLHVERYGRRGDGRWDYENRDRDDRYGDERDRYERDRYDGGCEDRRERRHRHHADCGHAYVEGRWVVRPFPGAVWVSGYYDRWGDWVPGYWARPRWR